MGNNRQERIKLLSRVNRERAATPPFLARLSEALGESLDNAALLPLSEADQIVEAFRDGYQGALTPGELSYRRFFRPAERNQVLRLADCLAERLPRERAYFITKMGRDAAVVNLTISNLLKHTASMIRLDGDSVSVLSQDHTQGVLIDHNADDPDQAYEVAAWGDQWSILLLACTYKM